MEIKTQVTQADLVEFHLFHNMRSARLRLRFLSWALLPPLAASGVLYGVTAGHLPQVARILFLGIVPGYFTFFYQLTRRRLAKQLEDSFKSGHVHPDLGDRAIDVEESGVRLTEGAQNRFLNWSEIPRVLVNNSYGYIYTSPDRAIIVPQRCFADGSAFALFMKVAVIYHWNVQRASAEASAPSSTPATPAEATTQQTGTSPMPALKAQTPIAFVSH